MAYTKTVWENLPSTNTPINATNLNKMEQGIYDANDKNIISIGLNGQYTSNSTGYQTLPLTKQLFKLGDKLSIQNGKIKIGSNVNNIMIFAQATINAYSSRATGAFNIEIDYNGTNISSSLNSGITDGLNITKNLAGIPLQVSENDVIGLSVYVAVNDVVSSYDRRTFLTIQVIN